MILNLGLQNVKCVLLVNLVNKPDGLINKGIGTKYPNIAQDYFELRHESIEIIKLNGSVESSLSRIIKFIVDLVEWKDPQGKWACCDGYYCRGSAGWLSISELKNAE